MAEDAVRAALSAGVPFESELDVLGEHAVTALFIVHAGHGAEELHPSFSGTEIWSHKWVLRHPIEVAPNLRATRYLTVPHDGEIGVCCHELGHLAFQWQDFYDPNYGDDGVHWSGTGIWDLMAGGSYNGCSRLPAHPAGLHKLQHAWIDVEDVTFTEGVPAEVDLEIEPYTSTAGKLYRVTSPKYGIQQYLLLENRMRSGFDSALPGEGLLVWRVDESGEMFAPSKPGLLLLQADGKHELERRWSEGDAGDPFPGSSGRTVLKPSGSVSTSFPGQANSGLTLARIRQVKGSKNIRLTIRYDGS
jgi:immune inhibitor A